MSFGKHSVMEKWADGICTVLIVIVVTSCGVALALRSRPADQSADESEDDYAPASHDAYRYPPSEPKFTDAATTLLRDDEEVIGIVVDSKPYAFPRNAMMSIDRHIINLNLDGTPVSVTYCDMVDQARVLCRARGGDPFELSLGGVDDNYEMMLVLDGARYRQSSPDLPLDDVPFERTSLSSWIAKHPDSKIYER